MSLEQKPGRVSRFYTIRTRIVIPGHMNRNGPLLALERNTSLRKWGGDIEEMVFRKAQI